MSIVILQAILAKVFVEDNIRIKNVWEQIGGIEI